jgi:hypothetical protein
MLQPDGDATKTRSSVIRCGVRLAAGRRSSGVSRRQRRIKDEMSQAESPKRAAPDHQVSIEDVRQLMGASTPHFALQLRERITKLIAKLSPEDPARLLGEQEIRRLDALAVDGETRGGDAQDGQRALASVRD